MSEVTISMKEEYDNLIKRLDDVLSKRKLLISQGVFDFNNACPLADSFDDKAILGQ